VWYLTYSVFATVCRVDGTSISECEVLEYLIILCMVKLMAAES
jgi:hypothetical protein